MKAVYPYSHGFIFCLHDESVLEKFTDKMVKFEAVSCYGVANIFLIPFVKARVVEYLYSYNRRLTTYFKIVYGYPA